MRNFLLIALALALLPCPGLPAWTAPETLSPAAGGRWNVCYNFASAVTADAENNLHAVFFEEPGKRVYYRRYDRAAASWDPALRLDEYGGRDAALTLGSDGTLHVFFKSRRALCYRRRSPDGDWSDPYYLRIDDRTPGFPSPLPLPDGDVAVAMVAERAHTPPAEIWLTTWRRATDVFDPPVRLSDDPVKSGAWMPTLAIHEGDLHVVWRDDRSGEFDLYGRVKRGANWMETARLTDDPARTYHPRLAVDPEGVLRLFFMDRRNGNPAIWEKEWTGEGWTAERVLFDGGAEAHHPTTVRTTDGRSLLFWEDTRETPGAEISYAVFSDGAWSKARRISDSPEKASVHTSAAVTPDGEVVVVYAEEGEILLQRLAPGGLPQ
ncbi:MAG: sialidase family protein [Candidatus Zixiibacteriota bacterium]|jgi:hypothetical protein